MNELFWGGFFFANDELFYVLKPQEQKAACGENE